MRERNFSARGFMHTTNLRTFSFDCKYNMYVYSYARSLGLLKNERRTLCTYISVINKYVYRAIGNIRNTIIT